MQMEQGAVSDARGAGATGANWTHPLEADLPALAPRLHELEQAWLAQIDSLEAPERKTHELIQMVCMAIRGNQNGVAYYASLATEVGATWEDIAGSLVIIAPSFGLLAVAEALPHAKRGFESTDRA